MKENPEKFNWKGIDFPVSLKRIDKLEKQNPEFLINVFRFEGENVYLLRLGGAHVLGEARTEGLSGARAEGEACKRRFINLVLISSGETNHYCRIKNKSRLFSSQVRKHKSAVFFCDFCINHFPNKPALEKHLEYCFNHKAVRTELPGGILNFKNFNRSMRVPFAIYADFESTTEKISTCSNF